MSLNFDQFNSIVSLFHHQVKLFQDKPYLWKKIDGKFVPVGEESFVTAIKTDDGFVILLVDEDGFTKAQTKALEKEDAREIFNKVLASGITEFSRKEIKIWTDTYPTVQDELK